MKLTLRRNFCKTGKTIISNNNNTLFFASDCDILCSASNSYKIDHDGDKAYIAGGNFASVGQFSKEQLPLYEELFRLKKTLFNEQHDITIYGYEVELYVQNESESHFSSGVFSVLNDEWIVDIRIRGVLFIFSPFALILRI